MSECGSMSSELCRRFSDDGPLFQTLRVLHFQSKRIRDEGVRYLADALKINQVRPVALLVAHQSSACIRCRHSLLLI